MGNRCVRFSSCCRKLWSRICCCCNNNKAQTRSHHGTKGKVHTVNRIETWEEKITEANNNGKILVVKFSAPWCVPCKKIEPVFRELASRYPSMIFVTVDVEELAEFSNEWNVEATPTIVFLKDGRQMDKLVGAETSDLQKKTAAAADLILRMKQNMEMEKSFVQMHLLSYYFTKWF